MDRAQLALAVHQQDIKKLHRLFNQPLSLWGRRPLFRDVDSEIKRIETEKAKAKQPKSKTVVAPAPVVRKKDNARTKI